MICYWEFTGRSQSVQTRFHTEIFPDLIYFSSKKIENDHRIQRKSFLLASCPKVPFSPGWPRLSLTRSSCCQLKVESERWQGNLINIFLVTLEQFFINGLWTGFGQMANFFKQNNFFEQDFCTNRTNDVTNEIVLDCSERNCWP